MAAAPSAAYVPNVVDVHHVCGSCSRLMFNDAPKWTQDGAATGAVPT